MHIPRRKRLLMWGSQSWCRLTKEAAYGVYDDSAAPADIIWVRLASNNACTIRTAPQRQVIRSADGGNRRRQVCGKRKAVGGGINTLFYPSQAAFWLGAGLTLAGTPNDLSSYTCDFHDTVRGRRFLGGKIATLAASGTAQSDY